MAQSPLVKIYLFLYNLSQFVGWSFILARFASEYALHGNDSRLWSALTPVLWILQGAQALEVVHCLIKLVPSSPMQAIIQLSGRFFNLFLILTLVPPARLSLGFPLLLVAWTLSETTRYIYYAINIYSYVPYVITYLRYSLFIFANPIGLAGEILILLAALPALAKNPQLLAMGVANSVKYVAYILVPIFTLAFINMYMYMFSQRKKVLAATSGKPAAKTSAKPSGKAGKTQ